MRSKIFAALLLALVAGCGDGEPQAPEPAAAPRDAIVVPGDRVFPEGVAVDARTGRVFVGSTTDGTVFAGDPPRTPLRPFLPAGRGGRTAATGLTVDDRGRLWVAGRGTGRAFVHDAASGRPIRALRAPGSGRTLVNDVAVTATAAYVTDSFRPVLYRARLDGDAVGELEPWLELGTTPIPTGTGFGLNGVVATPDGRHLITVHFDTGRLFRIDTRTRAVREVRVRGAALRTGDGLVLRGRTLFVVREEPGDVVPLRLSADRLDARAGAPFGGDRLGFPTTAAVRGDRLLVVDSQLDRAPDRARPPFTVAVLPLPAGVG